MHFEFVAAGEVVEVSWLAVEVTREVTVEVKIVLVEVTGVAGVVDGALGRTKEAEAQERVGVDVAVAEADGDADVLVASFGDIL